MLVRSDTVTGSMYQKLDPWLLWLLGSSSFFSDGQSDARYWKAPSPPATLMSQSIPSLFVLRPLFTLSRHCFCGLPECLRTHSHYLSSTYRVPRSRKIISAALLSTNGSRFDPAPLFRTDFPERMTGAISTPTLRLLGEQSRTAVLIHKERLRLPHNELP